MKKRFILRILRLLIDLTLMTSLSLAACSTAATPTPTRAVTLTSTRATTLTPTQAATLTPTKELSVTVTAPSSVASEPVNLSQVLDRWDAQRVADETSRDESMDEIIQKYLEEGEKSSSPLPYALAGLALMMDGDMRAAIEALDKAVAIDLQADIPHFLLADVIYRLAFFDMVDRELCSIELTPIQEIPEASLHHGRLRIEIWELINPGRPAVYGDLLTSLEIDELAQLRMRVYLLWLVRSTLVQPDAVEAALQDLGGPPEVLPVPECEPDDKSKHFLRMAYEEISLAEQGKPLETPGMMVVDKDRMADMAAGIQVLLGDEVVPATQTELVSYWIQRGYEMEASGDPAAAVDCYDEVLRLDPQSYVANFNKGNALVALSKFQEAIQAYDKALAVKNTAEAIHNREIVRLLAAGVQWPDGPKALEFLEDDLDSPDRKTQLGAALLLFLECKKESPQACDIWGVAVQQDPSILEDLSKLEVPNR